MAPESKSFGRFMLNHDKENSIIRLGIILFWFHFWLLNILDKLLPEKSILKIDRLSQVSVFFSAFGIENVIFANIMTGIIIILEIAAFFFSLAALLFFARSNQEKAHSSLFWSILSSLLIFSFFAIGDQVFGGRDELLEHTIYWIALVISWYIYTHTERLYYVSDI